PVTFWNSAPTTLAQLSPFPPGRGSEHLRLVFLSGDYTPLSLPGELRAAFPNARVISLGGATEATVWSNWFEIDQVDPAWRAIPYGRPIDGARYHILDERLRPCPPGTEGGLFIAGACLAQGYAGEPERTAERFIRDPYALRPGERMYATGDRALYDPDGLIHFRGRADDQVKIRGYRVEPGEVEHRLREHPAVREAVVLPVGEPGDRRLAAYVLPAGDPPTVPDLREHAARTLPGYMVPNHVTFLDAFPTTPNGKIDRSALLEPHRTPSATGQAAPDEELRAEIAELFAERVGASVDPDGDLWDQGATSFTLVQVSNVLQDRYGFRIPVSAVLADPTVAAIADWLREALGGTSEQLPLAGAPPSDLYVRRRSRRDLLAEPVPADAFAGLLALLREADGRSLYPSAGSTYAVRTYVHVKPDGVDGVPAGLYLHHPADHTLEPIPGPASLDRDLFAPGDRTLYDAAGFALYLVGRTGGIAPRYGADADRLLALEAGHIAELLLLAQAELGLGLCEIGGLDEDRLHAALGTGPGDPFLLGLTAGPADHEHSAPRLLGPPPAPRPETARPNEPRREPSDDVAIIGMAGRYPGAPDLDAFWRLLEEGADLIGEPPAERRRPGLPDMYGSFLDDVDRFDPLFFGIAPRDADRMDPQERLFLEVGWAALEDAGYPRARLHEAYAGKAGVFAGTMYSEYPYFAVERTLAGDP
ncbi:MAG: AMP-binding protein, partial [Streptosporangiales bacterium]|nr:AMP-binding protein [Streptosporangiales bacterium]